MMEFSYDRCCDEVIRQANLLDELLRDADLSRPVPTCPGWTLADLQGHVVGNLITLEAAVRDVEVADDAPQNVADAGMTFSRTLRAAGADHPAEFGGFTLPTAFWVRRAMHDLAIHRADAAFALDTDYTIDPQLAVDAIDELLENVASPRPDHGPALDRLDGSAANLHLHATDTDLDLAAEWFIESGSHGLTWRHDHEKAAVALRGPLTDVLTVIYRRRSVDHSQVDVLGSRELLDLWLDRLDLG